ncbi:MAG: long-chain fatty acid--CoA ligase, partial [Chitinophagales bacterium]|nr:long-chain fatty acid--CoA ligase [Chitinophagales bacterium]
TNRPEWHFTDLACLQIGAIDVPIYPTISSKEYEFIFNHAEIKFIFLSDKVLYRKIESILPNVPSVQGVFCFDENDYVTHWKTLLSDNTERDVEINAIKNSIQPDDLATIIYTSGTTGTPKGVMLSHHNIVSNVKDCLLAVPVGQADIILSFLPLSHVFERTLNYTYFAGGASVYFADGLESISDHLQDIRPHYFATVPRLLERVYEKLIKKGKQLTGIKKELFFWAVKQAKINPLGRERTFTEHSNLLVADKFIYSKWREALGGRIKAIICGSAPLQERLATIFTNAGIPILEGYGLTECSPVVSVVPFRKQDFRAGCVGKVLHSVQVQIAADGELLIKGPNVMMGYYKNPEETAKSFNSDGWLLSGDIGEFTADGFLKITDRKKELFKTSGGKYVAPSPIENKLKESNYIEQVALVGDNEKYISALILPNFDNLTGWAEQRKLDATDKTILTQLPEVKQLYKDIITNFNVNFGKVEQIKQFELITDEWNPENGLLTATMKLKRKAIKEKYQNIIDKFYSKNL